jgi:large subunit ribosomal protein L24
MATTSTQPRKQRKTRYTAPIHLRGKYLHAPLSPDLRSTHNRRRTRVVKGDTVRVLRGDFAGQSGLVDEVNGKSGMLFVHGISSTKADGTEVPRPVNPSNVQITKLNLKDPMRKERLGTEAE